MDPLAIERRYRTAWHTLTLLTGPRNRLLHLIELVEFLHEPGNLSSLPAYRSELLPLLIRLIRATDFTGTPASLHDRAAQALAALIEPQPGARLQALAAPARDALRRAREAEPGGPAAAHDGRDAVWIPMVEEEYLLSGFTPRFAALVRLSVELRLLGRKTHDEIHVAQFASPGPATHVLRDLSQAARAVLHRWKGIRVPTAVGVYCSSAGSALLNGASLGTGLGVAMVCALLRATLHREEYLPGPDVAFTGMLDGSGRLQPVDEDGLRLKVEACLHSPISTLVLPAAQLKEAAGHLKMLQDASPREGTTRMPELTLVGISGLEEIFYDRRLVRSRPVPLVVHTGRLVWKRRRPLTALLLVVLLAITGRLLYGPLDREPADATYGGTTMTIRNRAGEAIQTIEVGHQTALIGANRTHNVVRFLDVDGDGTREVLWTQNGIDDATDVGAVHCRTVGAGEDRWVFPIRKRIDIPANPPGGESFGAFALEAGDFDLDGYPEVYVVARHQAFPSMLLKLDARNGAERGFYLHAGHIISMHVGETDGDGRPEILLTGVNNSMGEAFLAVLEPGKVEGHGPLQGRYAVKGIPQACERGYLLIPKTIVGEAYPDRIRWNNGSDVSWLSAPHMIQVTITEYPTDANPGNDRATYSLLLSPSLEPVNVRTGDDFDMLAERYFREGRIRAVPDAAYWSAYVKRIRFWNGTGWSPVPVQPDCNQ